jgi:hypothetical protein
MISSRMISFQNGTSPVIPLLASLFTRGKRVREHTNPYYGVCVSCRKYTWSIPTLVISIYTKFYE